MIRNLNPIAFQGFGTVLSERAHTAKRLVKEEKNLKTLPREDASVYKTQGDVWMDFSTGMSVLSVSKDGENFLHFYLDKPVCIKADVYFCLFAFRGDAQAYVVWDKAPVEIGKRDTENLSLDHRLHARSIYTYECSFARCAQVRIDPDCRGSYIGRFKA